MAKRPTSVFEKRRPQIPLIRNPRSGKSGMSQRFIGWSELQLHGIDLVDLQRFPVFEYREDDRQANSGFGGSHDHNEERVDLAVDLPQLVRERDEAQIHGIQHQLYGHEHGDDVLAVNESG